MQEVCDVMGYVIGRRVCINSTSKSVGIAKVREYKQFHSDITKDERELFEIP